MKEKSDPAERRPPRPITRDYLFRAAVHYLERYASSSGNLRRVLERKIVRRARERNENPADFVPLIAETIAHLTELKLLDDDAFAQAKVASLRRRGTSRGQVLAKLGQKGVERETAAAAMAADETEEVDAALAYARRRRIGPFRSAGREEKRDRDVAAMMRAGFSYSLAATVIDGELPPSFAG